VSTASATASRGTAASASRCVTWRRGASPTTAPCRRGKSVRDALRVRAAVALELRLDPIDGVAISLGALAAIAKPREPFDRCLVFLEIQPRDHDADRIIQGIG